MPNNQFEQILWLLKWVGILLGGALLFIIPQQMYLAWRDEKLIVRWRAAKAAATAAGEQDEPAAP